MGIQVNSGILTNGGVTLTNVYMCFRDEVIYVTPCRAHTFMINTYYRIYNKSTDIFPDVRVPLVINSFDPSKSVYTCIYDELKRLYPDSINIF